MKSRHVADACVLLILALAPPSHAQLANGGFEAGGGSLSGWQTFNNVVPNVIAAPLTPFEGSHVAKIFGGFNDDPNYSGMQQSLPATAGQTWEATARVRHNTGDALAGTANEVTLKIEFYRVVGGAYGTADMVGEHATPALNAGSPLDAWQTVTVAGVAPAETVEARIAVVFVNNDFDPGAALVDGITFEADTPVQETWVLVWSDEFDGTTVNAANWEHMIGDGSQYGIPGWGNNELQYYTDRPENCFVAGGELNIVARAESYQGHAYTSARLRTKNRQDFLYGRMEARIKLPGGGQGLWPAFWMMPTADAYGGWAASGEIDIMETVNVATTVHGTIHYGGSFPGNTSTGGSIGGAGLYSDDYHVYGIEWDPDQIRWFVDGVPYFTTTSATWFSDAAPGNDRAPFDQAFHFLLNVAVGGNWPGPPNGSTALPSTMAVDYVRVYNRAAAQGEPLLDITDTTAAASTVDGTIDAAEYAGSTPGINNSAGDRIGAGSMLFIDSGAGTRLDLAIRSVVPWPSPSSWGVVVYVDSQDGGFASTALLSDVADLPARLASGNGTSGQSANLFFAPGFLPDFAIVIEAAQVRILELDATSHTLVNGALLGAATDLLGGNTVTYRTAGGTAGATEREIELRLEHLGLQPTVPFDFIATHLGGNTAFRSNEFVGVAPGNAFDGAAIGAAAATLKDGDFIRFTSVFSDCDANTIRDDCDIACGAPGGACDVSGCGTATDANANGLPDTCDPPIPVYGDVVVNGLVDLFDIACVASGFSVAANCPAGDIFPCGGNAIIDLDDLLAVIDAFAGHPRCSP